MKRNYTDITDRLGEPLWWDDQGVPRYVPFHPGVIDVMRVVALMEIRCQECHKVFKVASAWNNTSCIMPTPESAGSLTYGDPPFVMCCRAGYTMCSEELRILEMWQFDVMRPREEQWRRLPEYEFEFIIPDDDQN